MTMNMIAMNVGYAALLVFVILVVVAVATYAYSIMTTILDNRTIKIWDRGRDFEKHRLYNQSYWFSEDPNTVRLIQNLSEDKKATVSIREEWQKGRKKTEE